MGAHQTFDSKMKKKVTIGIAICVALLGFFMPWIHYSGRIDVKVTWSFQEATPTEHTVTLQDKSFSIPAGRSVTRVHNLSCSGTSTPFGSTRGWSFLGQRLMVDGEEIFFNQVHTSQKTGEIRVLGMGSPPSMKALIVIDGSHSPAQAAN